MIQENYVVRPMHFVNKDEKSVHSFDILLRERKDSNIDRSVLSFSCQSRNIIVTIIIR